MRIGGLIKFSLIDYPGKMAAVVFTQGCNFRCPYCFNSDLLSSTLSGNSLGEEDVFALLGKRYGLLEGVVISGGEPTQQPDLIPFLERVRGLGYCIKVDTNGSHPAVLREIIAAKLCDYIAMDIKAPLDRYEKLAGVSVDIEAVKESIQIIITSPVDHEFRTTMVKPLLSLEDAVEIRSSLPAGEKYFVQGFSPAPSVLDKNLLWEGQFSLEELIRLERRGGILVRG